MDERVIKSIKHNRFKLVTLDGSYYSFIYEKVQRLEISLMKIDIFRLFIYVGGVC
jgi:hypothetical protein